MTSGDVGLRWDVVSADPIEKIFDRHGNEVSYTIEPCEPGGAGGTGQHLRETR